MWDPGGKWDVRDDDVVFVSTTAGFTSIRAVNGDAGRKQQLTALQASPPAGDIMLSSSRETGAIVFVNGENQDGEIDMLSRRPPKQ